MARLASPEAMLAPTLNALPKNEHGRFGRQRRGNATPTALLQGCVSEFIQTLFVTWLGSRGIDAYEVAEIAATRESSARGGDGAPPHNLWGHWSVSRHLQMITLHVDSLLDVNMAGYNGRNLSAKATETREAERTIEFAPGQSRTPFSRTCVPSCVK